IMPNMNGIEAYRLISEQYPDMLFVFTSGFTFDHSIEDLRKKSNVIDFIRKPYTLSMLCKVLRKAGERELKRAQRSTTS
ncbi:MAG: hypothetical protein ACRCUT_01290, partial [Spirochaetota bacterium]